MAQAAWSRPGLRLSSWSCMGPRRRPSSNQLNYNDGGDPKASSSTRGEASEPFFRSSEASNSTSEMLELPVSSSEGLEWSSGSSSDEIQVQGGDDEVDDCDDILEHERHENHMTEVELWQQLEQELYDEAESGEADVVKEIREEEAAAIAEVSHSERENAVPNTKEVHRFFPAGKIMHIVTLLPDEVSRENDNSSSSTSSDQQAAGDMKVGIFLTPRSLYSKLRLSQTMISDHFMPVYRRQIEKLIRELEEEISNSNSHHSGKEIEQYIL